MAEYIKKRAPIVNWNSIALVLIITSNICFYTKEMQLIYYILSFSGIIISILNSLFHFKGTINKRSCIVWLIAVYTMYFIYGFLFLQAGKFPWESLLLRLIENISIYLAATGILKEQESKIVKPFIISGILSSIFLIIQESGAIISGGVRIGDSLSGNVNTVGFNFGIISMLVAWDYCRYGNRKEIILLILLSALVILTGSKKAIIILALDLLMILIYKKKKASIWLKVGLVSAISLYSLFNVPYLYDIAGSRIETMIATTINGKQTNADLYSYSTDMRTVMINEAANLFITKPIFGMGYNSFMANTVTQYDYSHCNYTELLCSFGIIGFVLYYMKQTSNIRYIIKNKIIKSKYRDFGIICLFLIAEMFIADWATVTFSGQCLGYIPITLTSAIVVYLSERNKDRKYEKQENHI